jgi:hypothetical protein
MDLLTIYIHHSELQAITAPTLISTFHKSPQHPRSLFQPAVTSAVPWKRLLKVEILQLHALRSYFHSFPYRTDYQLITDLVRVTVRVTLRLAVYRQSLPLDDRPLETTSNFIFQLNACGYSPYVTSSLMRGRVCPLQLLLVLASAVILRSESHKTHDQILLPQIRDSPTLEDQVPVFISPSIRLSR